MYFIEFFLDNFKKFSKLCKENNFKIAYDEICFIQYICETIIFIGTSMEPVEKLKKDDQEEGLNEISFDNKHVLISFLNPIYIIYRKSINNNQNISQNKSIDSNLYIDELVKFYPKIIEWKEKLKK